MLQVIVMLVRLQIKSAGLTDTFTKFVVSNGCSAREQVSNDGLLGRLSFPSLSICFSFLAVFR